jgi:hypothetical protein
MSDMADSNDGAEDAPNSPIGRRSGSWKPRVGRQQSWNEQDLKRLMHKDTLDLSSPVETNTGFTESGKQ